MRKWSDINNEKTANISKANFLKLRIIWGDID